MHSCRFWQGSIANILYLGKQINSSDKLKQGWTQPSAVLEHTSSVLFLKYDPVFT